MATEAHGKNGRKIPAVARCFGSSEFIRDGCPTMRET
jgi:hypothetical protein